MCDTAALVRARERAWRRAAAAWLCAAEEAHGMLGRAWVGSGSADVRKERPLTKASLQREHERVTAYGDETRNRFFE